MERELSVSLEIVPFYMCTQILGFINVRIWFLTNKYLYSGNDFPKKVFGFFQSLDSRLVVYSCDFFKMKPDILENGKCDAVYDRGAFEAIYESDRQAYVRTILSLLTSDFRYILNVYEYEDEVFICYKL